MRAFRELAEVLQKLERTSSSSMLVALLAEFLSRLDPDEAKAVAHLLRGELAPPFEALEIGMAERMVVRAVADAYTVSERRVERLLATTGDLGTVAEILAAAKRGRAASIFMSSTNCGTLLVLRARARKPRNVREWRGCFQALPVLKLNTLFAQFSVLTASVSPI